MGQKFALLPLQPVNAALAHWQATMENKQVLHPPVGSRPTFPWIFGSQMLDFGKKIGIGMKVKMVLGLVGFMMLFAGMAFGQSEPTDYQRKSGIVAIAYGSKSVTYDIRLTAVANADAAQALDLAMLEKQGILSSHTDASTRVCRVEVLNTVTPRNLTEVIESKGMGVAKAFNE